MRAALLWLLLFVDASRALLVSFCVTECAVRPTTRPRNDEDKDFLTCAGKKCFGVSEQREATLRGHPGKFGHSVAPKRCSLSGCGVAMVSLFWFSSCRWEDASSRAQVSVPNCGVVVKFGFHGASFLSFSFSFIPSLFLFALSRQCAPRRLNGKQFPALLTYQTSKIQRFGGGAAAESQPTPSFLPPSPPRSICELPFLLGAEKSKSPGAQRAIKVFCFFAT